MGVRNRGPKGAARKLARDLLPCRSSYAQTLHPGALNPTSQIPNLTPYSLNPRCGSAHLAYGWQSPLEDPVPGRLTTSLCGT